SSGTLPALYQLPDGDFHDVATGNNGYAAGAGYDLVTGRGSPYANLVVSHLVQSPVANPATHLDVTSSATSMTAGGTVTITVKAFDANGNPSSTFTDAVHFSSSDSAAALPSDYAFTSADAGVHSFIVTLHTTRPQPISVRY